jgi:hypothetical protein
MVLFTVDVIVGMTGSNVYGLTQNVEFLIWSPKSVEKGPLPEWLFGAEKGLFGV